MKFLRKLLFIASSLCVISGTAFAAGLWKFNPYTNKPDYYETGTATGTFVLKSGDTMSGSLAISGAGISASTAIIGGVTFADLVTSTGTLVKKSGDTMTGSLTISNAGISASTGIFTSTVTVYSISATSGTFNHIYVSSITGTSPVYFQSDVEASGYVNATALKINGVDVGTSADTFWNSTEGGIYYGTNVGIGVTTPTVTLDVLGDALISAGITASSATLTSYLISPAIMGVAEGDLTISDGYGQGGLVVINGGNVGIGNTAPEVGFQVDTAIAAFGQLVGIGTVDPQASLHVVGGNILTDGIIYTPQLSAGDDLSGLKIRGTINSDFGMFVSTAGYLGINNDVPVEMLEVTSGNIKTNQSIISAIQIITPSATQVLYSTNSINPNSSYVMIASSGGAVALSDDVQITTTGVTTGQYIEIEGTSDTDTVTIKSTTYCSIEGGAPFTLGKDDYIALRFNGILWRQCGRSHND